jgi:hypothetical protein
MSAAPLGDVAAAHILDAGPGFDSEQLFLTRDSAQGDARWNSFVLQVGP